MTTVQVYGMFGFMRSLPFYVRAKNLVEIKDACLNYVQSDVRGKIRISYVVNPSTIRETEPFFLHVLDQKGNMLASTEGSIKIASSSFAPANLPVLDFLASNPIVQEPSSLRMTLRSNIELTTDALIEVNLPKELTLANNCKALLDT